MFVTRMATIPVIFRMPDLLDKISSVLSISLHADLTIGLDIPGRVKI